MWLSWLGTIPQSERSPVQFPVRAHVWIADSVPSWGVCKRQPMDVSLSYRCFAPSFLPPFPSL